MCVFMAPSLTYRRSTGSACAVPELRLSIALVDAASNAGCRGTAGCDLDGVGDSGVSSCILPVSLGEKCARLTREVLRRILAP
jgi:hypothetical protein